MPFEVTERNASALEPLFGGEIVVPPGTSVELGGFHLFGGQEAKVALAAEEARNRLKVTSFCLAGGVEVHS